MSDGGVALASPLAVIPRVVKLWKLQVILPSLNLIWPLDCIVGVLGRGSNVHGKQREAGLGDQ